MTITLDHVNSAFKDAGLPYPGTAMEYDGDFEVFCGTCDYADENELSADGIESVVYRWKQHSCDAWQRHSRNGTSIMDLIPSDIAFDSDDLMAMQDTLDSALQ